MRDTYQAVIIGGGPAGAAAALMLARAGWSVAVVEKAGFPRRKVCGEFVSATAMPLLRDLGVADSFLRLAGPEVRQVGLFVNDSVLISDMPRAETGGDGGWGRALGREHLDQLLLRHAAEAGATVWQPWTAAGLDREGGRHVCRIVARDKQDAAALRAPVVILAHGSWDPGSLPTQAVRRARRPSDLFAFKARFRDARLPAGLMPLLVFPGGYGGMVHTDGDRLSLSCCIRRETLDRCRRARPEAGAAEAVFEHIRSSCRGVRDALAGAELDGAWLSVGPIRPVLRARGLPGTFLIGNAAGEAHPIIAEGITMALQSARLLCDLLISRQQEAREGRALPSIARAYAAGWRRNFSSRLYAGSLFAALARTTTGADAVAAALGRFPAMLTAGARWSGKVTPVLARGGPS
ncbi:MAG: FAD-dependent oxidoreductase [Nitrospirae bacterium]|nr:MAG: FAD-dependent oxidoreductase [Nitrospirota bacterium]